MCEKFLGSITYQFSELMVSMCYVRRRKSIDDQFLISQSHIMKKVLVSSPPISFLYDIEKIALDWL